MHAVLTDLYTHTQLVAHNSAKIMKQLIAVVQCMFVLHTTVHDVHAQNGTTSTSTGTSRGAHLDINPANTLDRLLSNGHTIYPMLGRSCRVGNASKWWTDVLLAGIRMRQDVECALVGNYEHKYESQDD